MERNSSGSVAALVAATAVAEAVVDIAAVAAEEEPVGTAPVAVEEGTGFAEAYSAAAAALGAVVDRRPEPGAVAVASASGEAVTACRRRVTELVAVAAGQTEPHQD